MKQKLVSLVISAYNEEGNIDKLYQEIIKTIKNLLNISASPSDFPALANDSLASCADTPNLPILFTTFILSAVGA